MILFYSPINGSGTGKDLRVLLGTGTAVAGDSYKINQIKEKNIDTRILNRIIREQRIYSLYQPIISLKRGTILGMEALARGVDPQSGETVPPDTMFSRATKDGRGLELDRVCRDAALKGFAGIEGHKRLLLSLNLDISCVDRNAAGSGFLLSQTQASGISNNHIVLEILESKACSTEALLKFVSTYKNKNFLIALDDVGSGFSNLERIPLVKPDILKLDRSLVREVDKHFYKQELVRSFVRTAQCIGSQVVAEGVEGPDEVICLLELGIELFQGFYFARPSLNPREDPGLAASIKRISALYKKESTRRINEKWEWTKKFQRTMDRICSTLNRIQSGRIDYRLARCLEAAPELECLYILNEAGIQESSTICNPERLTQSRQILYEPAAKGSDHSLKEYYLPIQAGQQEHTTTRYISLASGNPCVTIARFIQDSANGPGFILCADIECPN